MSDKNEIDCDYMQNITCPFCGETDFDKIGLKSHLLNGDCDVFENIHDINRMKWGLK